MSIISLSTQPFQLNYNSYSLLYIIIKLPINFGKSIQSIKCVLSVFSAVRHCWCVCTAASNAFTLLKAIIDELLIKIYCASMCFEYHSILISCNPSSFILSFISSSMKNRLKYTALHVLKTFGSSLASRLLFQNLL